MTTICMPDHIERERLVGTALRSVVLQATTAARDEATDNDVKAVPADEGSSVILPVVATALAPDFSLCDRPRPTESEGLWIVLSRLAGPEMRQADWNALPTLTAHRRRQSGTC